MCPPPPSSLGSASQDTPVTAVQNFLQATSLNDVSLRSEESLEEVESIVVDPAPSEPDVPRWTDIDQADAHDPLYSSEYAPEIYTYMQQREVRGGGRE